MLALSARYMATMTMYLLAPQALFHSNTHGHSLTHPPYSRMDQMRKIIETIRSRNVNIAVITNKVESLTPGGDDAFANAIVAELTKMLSGSKALVYEYVIKKSDTWFEYLRSIPVDNYVFIGLPPFRPYQYLESEFFKPGSQRITEVVVVRRERDSRSSHAPVHYLEKFLHLDGSAIASDIVAMALCHFGG